jgi:hypothetical protein
MQYSCQDAFFARKNQKKCFFSGERRLIGVLFPMKRDLDGQKCVHISLMCSEAKMSIVSYWNICNESYLCDIIIFLSVKELIRAFQTETL